MTGRKNLSVHMLCSPELDSTRAVTAGWTVRVWPNTRTVTRRCGQVRLAEQKC